MVPTSFEDILAEFKRNQYFIVKRNILSNAFILACLKADPEIEQTSTGLYALEKWSRTRLDEMIIVLREIGHPAHYKEITEKTNLLLPPEQRTNPRVIHAHLGRLPKIFVRVGHGMFGLVEWGLPDDGNLANAVCRVLEEAGQILHIDEITNEVLNTWCVNPSSVYAAIDNDNRIVRIEKGHYGLAEWNIDENNFTDIEENGFDSLINWFDEWLNNNVS